ncbi:MAG TPA: flagellar hook-basal body complex protein FliE [Planctomicrobium sp.]|nr:flagellar hook-basal body complex protein FliE [Planctomicrobium sp.]
MNIGSITSGYPIPSSPGVIKSEAGAGLTVSPAVSPAGGDVPFSKIMNQFLHQVDQQQQTVTHQVNDLLAGKADNIHEIAINVAQADIAFRMVMEVRDKMITAYQEVMRMQV